MQYPYPTSAVARRWRDVLRDRLMHAYLLEIKDSPVGYVAFDGDTVHHLGVAPNYQRRGYGTALLEFACMEIFAGGAPGGVLLGPDRQSPRTGVYRSQGWTETGERRNSEYPPHPQSLQMTHRNPHAPRRSL